MTNFGCRCGPIHVRLVVQMLKIFQCAARFLGEPDHYGLAMVISNWESGNGAFLRRLE